MNTGPGAPPPRAAPWRKVLVKIRRSPTTIRVKLGQGLEIHGRRLRQRISHRLFIWESWRRRLCNPSARGVVLNTRMVNATIPSISHWTDWRLTKFGFSGDLKRQPRTVYVKAGATYLGRFISTYLPLIHEQTRFVLITGDADATLPRQVDQRYPSYASNGFQQVLETLMEDPRLQHWYAENLDTPHRNVTPIPLGHLDFDGNPTYQRIVARGGAVAIRARPLKVFCAHRVRQGPQWQKRHTVSHLARRDWSAFVDYVEDVPYAEFFRTLENYPFVLCVGGGGLDPSPKAWNALMAGAIPIIERNTTTAAYAELPVAFIDRWEAPCLSPDQLRRWLDALHPQFEDPELRRRVLERMSMAHWLRRIHAHGPAHGRPGDQWPRP